MQSAEQSALQALWRFQPGQSGNPRGRESSAARAARLEAKVAELAAEFGGVGALSACERVMLEQAATLLLRRPRSAEDVVRHANSVQRLITAVGRRKRKDVPLHVPLRERLASGAAR